MITLLAWLPDEFMVLGIALIGLGLMVGLLTGRRAAALLGFTVLLALSGPFIDGFLDALIDVAPWWLLVLLGVWLIFALLGVVSRALIGRGAANEMVGSLAADVVRFGFRMVFGLIALPFRLVFGGRR
ncbi:MAG: hypothetical protein J0H49_13555 [Acidobacteria bacterium]|nr:hypothetical protein [Acidobacteriota bacterium]